MAKITLIEGHVDIKKLLPQYKIVNTRCEMAFIVKGEPIPRVVDAIMLNDMEFLKWVCVNSCYDVYIMFAKKIPAGFSKTDLKIKAGGNDIQKMKGIMSSKLDLFKMLDEVAFSDNRNEVYELLSKSYDQYIIVKYLMSNVAALGEENVEVLRQIDALALFKNTRSINELLAYAFQPLQGRVFWKYNYPRKADAEESEE